jgi:hypothetical protein
MTAEWYYDKLIQKVKEQQEQKGQPGEGQDGEGQAAKVNRSTR